MTQWDDFTKTLIGDNLQPFVSLLVPQARFIERLDKELKQQRTTYADNILQESWAYREMMRDAKKQAKKEGKAEGKAEGLQIGIEALRSVLVRTTNKRFPVLAMQAEQVSQSISDLEVLQQVIDGIIDAQAEDEARKVLIQAMS